MFVHDLEEVLASPIEVVISTPLSLKLLKCYSILLLQSTQPHCCEASMRRYYIQLQVKSKEMSDKLQEIKDRKCKPNWKGLIYIAKDSLHLHSDTITDREAVQHINNGNLKLSCFDILPEDLPVVEPEIIPTAEKKVSKKQK